MEKEKVKATAGGDDKTAVEGKVAIQGKNLEEHVQVKAGSTLADAIAEVKKQRPDFQLKNFTSVVLNGRTIGVNSEGALEENPVITENFTLSILQNFTGGR